MARPREFDTEALLDQVSLIFLESGLQRTSLRQLETLTGVKQVSLYNAFGSKEKLFLAARNLSNVGICDVASMDPVVLIRFEKVLVTLPALKLIEERLS